MNTSELMDAFKRREKLESELRALDEVFAKAAAAVPGLPGGAVPAPGARIPEAAHAPATTNRVALRKGVGARGSAGRVARWVEAHGAEDLTPHDVSVKSGVKLAIVQTVLGRMLAAGRVERLGHGLYRVKRADPAPAA